MSTMKNNQEILEAFRKNPDMMAIMTIIRDLGLKDSWLAAGSVRNFMWNLLSDKSPFDCETDVDVIFFDPDISYEETLYLEEKVESGLSSVPVGIEKSGLYAPAQPSYCSL